MNLHVYKVQELLRLQSAKSRAQSTLMDFIGFIGVYKRVLINFYKRLSFPKLTFSYLFFTTVERICNNVTEFFVWWNYHKISVQRL